jgi:hypothetical protein
MDGRGMEWREYVWMGCLFLICSIFISWDKAHFLQRLGLGGLFSVLLPLLAAVTYFNENDLR